jgi:hypothetical protein
VHKGLEGGRTVSRVEAVQGEVRVAELARMLGGRDITEATTCHAAELLARAQGAQQQVTADTRPASPADRAPTPRRRPVARGRRAVSV